MNASGLLLFVERLPTSLEALRNGLWAELHFVDR